MNFLKYNRNTMIVPVEMKFGCRNKSRALFSVILNFNSHPSKQMNIYSQYLAEVSSLLKLVQIQPLTSSQTAGLWSAWCSCWVLFKQFGIPFYSSSYENDKSTVILHLHLLWTQKCGHNEYVFGRKNVFNGFIILVFYWPTHFFYYANWKIKKNTAHLNSV